MSAFNGAENADAPGVSAPEGFREALAASNAPNTSNSDGMTLAVFTSEFAHVKVSKAMHVARLASTFSRGLITVFFATIVTCSLLIAVGSYARQWRVVPLLSGSMAPLINTGDAVVVMPIERGEVRVGDVLAFHPPDTKDSRPTIHRVIELKEIEGKIVVQTKGDANSVEDPWKLSLDSDQVWRVERTLPNVGWVMFEVGKPRAWCAALALIGVTLLLSVFTDDDDDNNDDNDDNDGDKNGGKNDDKSDVNDVFTPDLPRLDRPEAVPSLRARKALNTSPEPIDRSGDA